MTDYRISVFGGGSVGLCLAANFAAAGAEVTLLVRESAIETLSSQPIEVSGLLGNHKIPAGRVTPCDAANPGDTVFQSDMMVVTTKAYDVTAALEPFSDRGLCPPLLLLQNGIGAAEIAKATVGPDIPVFSTAMMIGMARESPGQVAVTAYSSPIFAGSLLGDDLDPLIRLLDIAEHGFVPMAFDEKIRETISSKVLFNSCMNPTCATTGLTLGELLENDDSRELIIGLADEALAAFARAYDYSPAWSGRDYVDNILNAIIFPGSQGHKTSMFQDIRAARKTEIDFLNGAIIRLARDNGLSAPRHEAILHLVKACEASAQMQIADLSGE
jgi:2-dehydropantoate 2-reductase